MGNKSIDSLSTKDTANKINYMVRNLPSSAEAETCPGKTAALINILCLEKRGSEYRTF